MQQEIRELWKSVRLSTEKGKLDLEKTEVLLCDMQEILRHKEETHPELCQILELHRLWVQVRNIRLQIAQTKELWKRVRWSLRQLEKAEKEHFEKEPLYDYPFRRYLVAEATTQIAEKAEQG